MRHRKFSQRLSRPLGARRATVRNLVRALLKYQRIKTTRAKAKFTQRVVERLITIGKEDSLHARRKAYQFLNDRDMVQHLFKKIVPLFKNRNSGFTRVIHLPIYRAGDGTSLVLLELTEQLPIVKPVHSKKEKAEKPVQGNKPEPEKTLKTETIKEETKHPHKFEKPFKKEKPKKFLGGLRRLFKKERDSL
ncbi:MAG: 50S ribosomal protein L17 [Candidatus Omnitrophota bacterium]